MTRTGNRGLLETCPHSGPACWRCVALDMERQRDAQSAALAEARRLVDATQELVNQRNEELTLAEARAAEALEAARDLATKALDFTRGAEVRSWPPGWKIRDALIAAAKAALRSASPAPGARDRMEEEGR